MSGRILLVGVLMAVGLFVQCAKDGPVPVPPEEPDPVDPPEWLIPEDEILDGGPGRDGIPALFSPFFISAEEATYLADEDIVLGLKFGGEIRAYPHLILDWHEIVNDRLGEEHICITYCPLTGTGVAWDRKLNGELTDFVISGLLYNSNMIAYNRETDSNWSQMLLRCVNGEQIGERIKTYQLIETTWKTWKTLWPETKVLSRATGHNQNYNTYPYGNYRTNNNTLIFPVDIEDNRLPWKERVLGVVSGGSAKAFRFETLPETGIGVINDGLPGKNIVVAGSREKELLVAFGRKLDDGKNLTFTPVQDALPVIMTDQEGNRWNIFGEAVSGPRQGTKLPHVDAFIGYWVAWGAFYPGLKFR
ncbi:DUF3179 domain-containing protein [Flavilitoribacter nigricans]|uniref:DUF3179 domain-containing protein n=1 Tax=Flavilitoribacter nigricans (strain ATCC 23147 / DSM 23189 / NBRC 102662 / NCIMB 1420 / SS-2) TaxID=1122177 RepID=A0A2D0N7Y0_FLAN2|nr:DUF3179 domain-containing protein [Flavilitoribacter nigricans]PHN04622.1 hypothetical protein CRP01_21710 [Flavilitoribacter nigricans DSM 23189 = NBRC 102662]